ncbi:mg2+ transporter protein [Diaporthe amygdali]|uniref:mg2+ transporter protein n=1 Tax=Phomopsis amygdali TaxID=1214568 RepID=UPI0022FE75FE|nr:mg2+ transporter protein [Diaporthe amygdali]KAJ0109519.1 mg2+ transporter protein [Diaporthe amygdali]
MIPKLIALFACASLASANPVVLARAVTSLDESAFAEAQQRDDTATRAASNINIKTSDGKCLSVDKLSGDFRANLTPIKVEQCGSTDGQGWDIITAGKHISAPQSMLIVSTSTNACFNFDPRRAAGNQVLLFSCGGRADGGGAETNSQIFPFSQPDGPQSLQPQNAQGKCLAVKDNVVDIADCSSGDATQEFLFSGEATRASGSASGIASGSAAAKVPRTTGAASQPQATGVTGVNTAQPAAVSGAGNTLDQAAVDEAQQRDDTAVRAVSNTKIRAPNGQCLTVDPTAGDFRMNLIPVTFADCSNPTTWDLITSGKHNDGSGGEAALIVSTATQGCISVDPRRQGFDQVNLFSCGGRADGSGLTNQGQLFPFTGEESFALAPHGGGR